ncbi:MAG: TlpA disulfide reductase family protein [Flavobacteriales bacterium]|nr:TlpA disulfide reductase family protein [Flavobacteriales bacterium]
MNKIFFVLALLFSTSAIAEPVIIHGNARSYAGNTLLVFYEDDYLSHQRRLLTQCEILATGEFEAQLDLTTTRELILVVSGVEAILYAEPGSTYELNIPAFLAIPGAKVFNKISVDAEFINPAEGELNVLIRSFNDAYTTFVNDHYQEFATENFKGSETYKISRGEDLGTSGMVVIPDNKKPDNSSDNKNPKEPEPFADLVSEFSSTVYTYYEENLSNKFFHDYIRYHLAQLELAAGYSKETLYEEYFFSQPFLHEHPVYMQFFSMLFDGTFRNALDGAKHDAILQAVNGWREFPGLNRAMSDEPLLTVEHVRHMVILLGLKDAYHRNLLQKNAIEELLLKTFSTLNDAKVAQTYRNLHMALVKNKQGWHLENFNVIDQHRNSFSSDSLAGKYVYYFFYADWCTSCLKEMQVMEKLYSPYKNYVELVSISMDETQKEFFKGLPAHLDQPWTFLYGPSDPLLREKFNLKSLPYAYMVDPQGNVISDYTRKPTEGIGNQFEEIKLKLSKPKEGQKTWKD